MDQSGDGEPNSTAGSEQCKQKYAKEGEFSTFVMAGDSESVVTPTAPGSPSTKATTVFNLGAAPFVSSTSSIPQTSHPSDGNGHNPGNLFPWNNHLVTSTPINGSSSSSGNKNPPYHHDNGASDQDDNQTPSKDIMELGNRLNAICLGIQSSIGQGNNPQTPPSSPLNNNPTSQSLGQMKAPPPIHGNILRHLNNNTNMGNLLQETNLPPMGHRTGSDYRAYFNSNLINGTHLNEVGGAQPGNNFLQRALNGAQLPNGLVTPQAINGIMGSNVNGMFPYRFDTENHLNVNSRQRITPGGVPPLGPPPLIPTAANQYLRGGPIGMVPPQNHYPGDHFKVGHQNGIIQLKLKDGIEIEMTLDGAIRVVNWRCSVSISLASSSNSAALIHPNGRVLQYHSRVEIMTYDGKNKNNFVRFAKIWYKGISFTSENNALVYLVDSGGTRTTTDTFMDLRNDITEQVFLTGSTHGMAYDNQAKKEVQNHKYWPALDGTEVHELNGFRIAQTVDGMVRITKTNKNILVRTSPGNGSATLTTAYIHCTASLGQTSHLFVRRGERRMHFDGAEFVVRNSGHSAGFDSNNLLRVY